MEEENQQQENSVNPVEEQPAEEVTKSKKGLVIMITALSFLIIGGVVGGYFFWISYGPSSLGYTCNNEPKICSDGSKIYRQPGLVNLQSVLMKLKI